MWVAEQVQATLGDGPCLAAARSATAMVVEEAELAQRWPVYYDRLVAETSLRSVLAVPLGDDEGVFAALNVYTSRPTFPDLPELEVVNERIGRLAGQILLGTVTGMEDPDTSRRPAAQTPYRTRLDVWTAVGMMMGAADHDSADALALLRGYAFAHDNTLDELGQQLIHRHLQPSDLI